MAIGVVGITSGIGCFFLLANPLSNSTCPLPAGPSSFPSVAHDSAFRPSHGDYSIRGDNRRIVQEAPEVIVYPSASKPLAGPDVQKGDFEARMQEKYSAWSVDDLRAHGLAMTGQVLQLGVEAANPRFDNGEGVLIGRGSMPHIDAEVEGMISPIRALPNGAIYQIVLPREEYPKIYQLHDEANWLIAEARQRSEK